MTWVDCSFTFFCSAFFSLSKRLVVRIIFENNCRHATASTAGCGPEEAEDDEGEEGDDAAIAVLQARWINAEACCAQLFSPKNCKSDVNEAGKKA
ncbi:MAG: hypothetical protein NWR66_00210, partial [Burkholderiaceae bacterium]|nr:hypothetical protein [Burkholderiaceae bacterium]